MVQLLVPHCRELEIGRRMPGGSRNSRSRDSIVKPGGLSEIGNAIPLQVGRPLRQPQNKADKPSRGPVGRRNDLRNASLRFGNRQCECARAAWPGTTRVAIWPYVPSW
jgi:hypothetical protein